MKQSASAGQIWEMSKAYMASDTVKRYDAVIEGESVENLGSFLQTHADFARMSMDTRDDERLQKFNVMKMIPTRRLGEIENMNEMYLITDEHGHDIGTYTITENGPVFKLSPKIRDANERILGEVDPKYKALLAKEFEIDSIEKLSEKLSKGEEIALSSKEQAEDLGEELEEEQGEKSNDSTAKPGQKQDPEEKEALQNMPADMRAEVVALCKNRNIKIKEIMVVQDAGDVYREMGEGGNTVSRSGGPVIMVRTGGSGAETKDNVLMFQKGKLIPNTEPNRDRMLELMYQHRGSQHLTDLNDEKEDSIKANLRQNIEEYEEQMKYYAKYDFQNDTEKQQVMDSLRSKLLSSSREDLAGYTPDSDGDIANLYKAIEEEANKENRDEFVDGKIQENKQKEQEEFDAMINPTANIRNH